jgi:hypothetical protein
MGSKMSTAQAFISRVCHKIWKYSIFHKEFSEYSGTSLHGFVGTMDRNYKCGNTTVVGKALNMSETPGKK